MGEERRPFRLGTVERWGDPVCGFGLEGDEQCSTRGTIHVGWLIEPLATSVTCDEHLAFIEANAPHAYETHAIGGDCAMPGALWHHPYEDEAEGYCIFPALDDASLLTDEVEPVVVDLNPYIYPT